MRGKGDFKGKHLEVSIDDTNPSYQDFTTELWAQPFKSFEDESFTWKLMSKWGSPEVQVVAASPAKIEAMASTPAVTALKTELGKETNSIKKGWNSLMGLLH